MVLPRMPLALAVIAFCANAVSRAETLRADVPLSVPRWGSINERTSQRVSVVLEVRHGRIRSVFVEYPTVKLPPPDYSMWAFFEDPVEIDGVSGHVVERTVSPLLVATTSVKFRRIGFLSAHATVQARKDYSYAGTRMYFYPLDGGEMVIDQDPTPFRKTYAGAERKRADVETSQTGNLVTMKLSLDGRPGGGLELFNDIQSVWLTLDGTGNGKWRIALRVARVVLNGDVYSQATYAGEARLRGRATLFR